MTDCKLLKDEEGKSKGIAFVTYSKKAGQEKALEMNEQEYEGRTIYVSEADNTKKGKGKDGKGKGKGKGKGPGEKPAGCKSVVVKGLSYEVEESDLQAVFANCGAGPTNVKVLMDRDTGASKGIAFVDFDDEAAVDEAMKLTDTELKGRTFFLNYAEEKGKDGKGKGKDGKGKGKDGKGKGKSKAQMKVAMGEQVYSGQLTSYSVEKTSGFINCQAVSFMSGSEVYAFKDVLERAYAGPGDTVAFFLHWSARGQPQASSPLLRMSGGDTAYALKGYYKATQNQEKPFGFITCDATYELFG